MMVPMPRPPPLIGQPTAPTAQSAAIVVAAVINVVAAAEIVITHGVRPSFDRS